MKSWVWPRLRVVGARLGMRWLKEPLCKAWGDNNPLFCCAHTPAPTPIARHTQEVQHCPSVHRQTKHIQLPRLYNWGLFNATAHVNKILPLWILIKEMIVSGHRLKGKCFNWFWCLFLRKLFFFFSPPKAIYPREIAFPCCLSCEGPAVAEKEAGLRGYQVKHAHELKSRSRLRSRSVISSNMSHKMRCRFPFSFELQVFSNPEALFKDWPLTWPVIPIVRSWWPLGINGQHEGHFLEKLWLSMCQFQWSIITKQAKSLSGSMRHQLALRLPPHFQLLYKHK